MLTNATLSRAELKVRKQWIQEEPDFMVDLIDEPSAECMHVLKAIADML